MPVFHALGEPVRLSQGLLASQALPAPQLPAFLQLATPGREWRPLYLFLTGEAVGWHTALSRSVERAVGELRSVAGSGIPVARTGLGRHQRLAGCCRTRLILLSSFFFFLSIFFFWGDFFFFLIRSCLFKMMK